MDHYHLETEKTRIYGQLALDVNYGRMFTNNSASNIMFYIEIIDC